MPQSYRLDNIGLINRDKKLSFKFNGVTYSGYEGDTLASALIANGVHLVGRSFKYHRATPLCCPDPETIPSRLKLILQASGGHQW